ncbi:MAG: PD-(D/E)XK nuclease family protein [Clostridia bacterium]|nr:PD-(D/E)XK nuclease family protein [Clostridia bacterium]
MEVLNRVADSFTAIVPYDENSSLYTGETYFKLKKIDKNAEVINACGNLPEEAEFIKRNLFTPVGEDFEPMQTNNVTLYEASDVTDEAEWLAKDVVSAVRDNGLRYKDIAVAVGSLADSLPAIERALGDYNVPYFVEKSTALAEHPVCEFILNFLDFIRRGLTARDGVKLIESGLFVPDKKLADRLVNYVYKNAITRRAFKKEFVAKDKNLKEFELIRQTIIAIEEKFSLAKTVKDYAMAVRNLLACSNAQVNLTNLTEALKQSNRPLLADFNGKVFDKIASLLSQMEMVMGDSAVSALDFKNLFISGAVGTQISSIPISNDAVYIGECKDVKIKSAKTLYAVGLNGDVPFTQSDTALLSDSDLSVLDGFDLIIEPKIKSVNLREKENVAVSLCSFTEKLKISYSTEKVDGTKNFKSDAVKSLADLFGLAPFTKKTLGLCDNVKSLSDGFVNETTALMELAKNYPQYMLNEKDVQSQVASFYKATEILGKGELKAKANEIFLEKNKVKSIKAGDNLSVSKGEISASMLETYFSCPYKNYASYVLRLQESPVPDVKVNETGTLLHKVNEIYADNIAKVSDKISSDALVCDIYNKLKEDDEFKKYSATPQTKAVLDRLIKESKKVCYNIYSSISSSSFKTLYQEAEFGKNGDFKGIEIEPKSGKISIKGKVDRVDGYSNYVRIIDYKSGKIDDSEESFYTGRKIQLYLYLNAFVSDTIKPAGAYYYPVKDEYSKEPDRFAMYGKTVDTEEIVIATDKELEEENESKIVNVKYKKNSSNGKREPYASADVLSEEDMYKFMNYSKLLSANSVDEIRGGYIEANPYDGACKYCVYGGMCNFCHSEGDLYRKVDKITVSTITKAVDIAEKQTDKAENGDE